MLTRIDHVMICVPDLERGIDAYTRIGFNIHHGGAHRDGGTHNAIAFFQDDYLELLSVREGAAHLASAGLTEFLARGGGLRYVIVQSNDLVADVAAMRKRGVEVSDANEGARRTPTGQELRWKMAQLGARNPLPVLFVQHLTALDERRRQAPGAGHHPNGVLRTDRVYIAVDDVAKAAETYSLVLGVPVPRLQRGNVIKADMAVVDLGPAGLTLDQPAQAGPAAEGLSPPGARPPPGLYPPRHHDSAAGGATAHPPSPP